MGQLVRYVTGALSGAFVASALFVCAAVPLHEWWIAWSWTTLEVSFWWPWLLSAATILGALLGLEVASRPRMRKHLLWTLAFAMAGGWGLQKLMYMGLSSHVSYEALWVYELQRPDWVELPLTVINAFPFVFSIAVLWYWLSPTAESVEKTTDPQQKN